MRFLCFMVAMVMVPGPLWAAQNAVPSATYESAEEATHQVWQIEAEQSQRRILNQMAQDMNDKASTRAPGFAPFKLYNLRHKEGPTASQIYARQLATKIAHQVVGEIDQLPPVQRALARQQLSAVQQNWQNILSHLNADVRSPEQLAQIKASLDEFSQSMKNTAYYEAFQKAALTLQDEIEHLQFLTQTEHPELNDIVAFKEGATPVNGELELRLNEASEYLFLTGDEYKNAALPLPWVLVAAGQLTLLTAGVLALTYGTAYAVRAVRGLVTGEYDWDLRPKQNPDDKNECACSR